MHKIIVGAMSAATAILASTTLAAAQVNSAQTTLQGQVLGISGHTVSLQTDAGQRVLLDDTQAVASHRAYGLQPFNHIIATGSYGPSGRFITVATRSYESREFAFRARVTSVSGYQVSLIRDDNGRSFLVNDEGAVGGHMAYGLRPGSHVLVEGKYSSDGVFHANRIVHVR